MTSFMKKQITIKMFWIQIDGSDGIIYYPCDCFNVFTAQNDYESSAEVEEVKTIIGYGARLSAAGYLDCTDWAVFNTEKEAIDYLEEG